MASRVAFEEVPGLAHPRIGDSLAQRYRLEKAAGRTEAGLVFDAVDHQTNRRVAIEVATSLREPEAWAKWQKDAMVAQKLEGDHVLRVFDVGVLANGVPYLVRERVLSSLAMELEVRERLPIPQAVAWTLEVAEAIAEAHASGAAHGDLRVDNVFVARGGDGVIVKVAWATAAKAEGAAKDDAARDVAGLGALLRQLATGRPSEHDAAPTLPTELAHAVARALSPEPSSAYGNVGDFAHAIAPYAPPGHASAKTIAFLLSRAGSSRPLGTTPMRPSMSSIPPTSLRGAWFDGAARESSVALAADLAPPPKAPAKSVTFAVVSIGLVLAVLGGSWLLFSTHKLPRWTGAAPPEEKTDTTEVTSAPLDTTPSTQPATHEPAAMPPSADAGLVPIDLSAPPAPGKTKTISPSPAPPRPASAPRPGEPASVPVSSLPDAPRESTTPTPTPAPAGPTPPVSAPPGPTSTVITPPAAEPTSPPSRSPDVPETFGSPD